MSGAECWPLSLRRQLGKGGGEEAKILPKLLAARAAILIIAGLFEGPSGGAKGKERELRNQLTGKKNGVEYAPRFKRPNAL